MTALRTRVLLEHENPRVLDEQAPVLEAAGFEVTSCAGPSSQDAGACPLVTRGYCHKAVSADVIVNGLPLGHLRVYVAQRAYLPDCPVLLSLSEAQRTRRPILDSLATTIPRTVTAAELVAAVGDAASGGPMRT